MSAPPELAGGRDAGRNGAFDGVEEADEPLAAMVPRTAHDHPSVEDVEGGEQRRRAVALAVAGRRPTFAMLAWQARLWTVESLNLAFLVNLDDHGVLRQVPLVAGDVLDLLGEPGIVEALEGAKAVPL
jgi:hypothetical protein